MLNPLMVLLQYVTMFYLYSLKMCFLTVLAYSMYVCFLILYGYCGTSVFTLGTYILDTYILDTYILESGMHRHVRLNYVCVVYSHLHLLHFSKIPSPSQLTSCIIKLFKNMARLYDCIV